MTDLPIRKFPVTPIEPETINAIIAYMKKVEPTHGGPTQEIENSYLRIERFRSTSFRNRAVDMSNQAPSEIASR
jgi:hypothetical protein